eukprot:4406466-Pleurochrysis_carterae.AAC.1
MKEESTRLRECGEKERSAEEPALMCKTGRVMLCMDKGSQQASAAETSSNPHGSGSKARTAGYA